MGLSRIPIARNRRVTRGTVDPVPITDQVTCSPCPAASSSHIDNNKASGGTGTPIHLARSLALKEAHRIERCRTPADLEV
jgi:hypothetical protein